MDCEKFVQHVLDALYDELDELTSAALRRHVEGCSRCAGVWAGRRGTREVGILPLVEAPDDLEARILDAVAVAQTQDAPLHKRVLRGLALGRQPRHAPAARHGGPLLPRGRVEPAPAPRPAGQHGPRPGDRARGAPGRAGRGDPSCPRGGGGDGGARGRRPRDGRGAGGDARGASAASAPADETRPSSRPRRAARARGATRRASGAFADARATRDASGCSAAVAKLDAIAVRFQGTQSAADAMWDEASCYKQMGDQARAQRALPPRCAAPATARRADQRSWPQRTCPT